ncbi:MAG: sensor histidine kinase [Candidatus Nanopelagicaceae bacterium]
MMKVSNLDDNWPMGRLKDFYDALVLRSAPVNSPVATKKRIDQQIIELLEIVDADYIVVDNGDEVLTCSEIVSNIGLVKSQRITSEALRKLVRNARNQGTVLEDVVAIPRGALTSGFHERRVRLSHLGVDGAVVILIFDDSEAERLDAVRRDFVANISHELKTPIGGISILAEAITEGSDDPELVKNFSARMKIEAERLTHLVQEIIDLSRIQDQNTALNSENFSLNELTAEAIYQSKVYADKHQVQVNFSPEKEIEFFGDRKQLLIAISNLVDNAISYSPERTKVNVVLKQSEDIAEIAISDQGVGIEESELPRIFERFYRVDPARSRDTGGTGLGLSIVKHVISNHGGEVQVWSVPGTGSTFTVLLPLTNVKDDR